MKRSCLLLSLLLLCLLCACTDPASDSGPVVNARLLASQGFQADAAEAGTSVQGTVYLLEADGAAAQVRIAASFAIGPDDWGGIAFYLPPECTVTSVLCSYPEEGEEGEDQIACWSTGKEASEKYTSMVEIGRAHIDHDPSGGGSGTVILEATVAENAGSELCFGVDAGAKTSGNTDIMGIAVAEIALSLP